MEENNETTMAGLFAIKVRVGNAEIEVFAPEKDFVLDESSRLIEQFILAPIVSNSVEQENGFNNGSSFVMASETKPEKEQNLVEFLDQFTGLQTNLDKILVIGYWCEKKLGQPHFTIEDIQVKYKKEIKDQAPANLKRDLDQLKKRGFLMPPERLENGQLGYTLSRSGIKEVESKMLQE